MVMQMSLIVPVEKKTLHSYIHPGKEVNIIKDMLRLAPRMPYKFAGNDSTANYNEKQRFYDC